MNVIAILAVTFLAVVFVVDTIRLVQLFRECKKIVIILRQCEGIKKSSDKK